MSVSEGSVEEVGAGSDGTTGSLGGGDSLGVMDPSAGSLPAPHEVASRATIEVMDKRRITATSWHEFYSDPATSDRPRPRV